MPKQLFFGEDARTRLMQGVNQVVNAMRVTLGPRGRNVVLDKKFGSPQITKDGVTVAKDIELGDPYENLGAEMVKEVAKKTGDVVGDGTTTAAVLAQAIVREGMKNIAAGANAMAVKRGIERAVEAAVGEIRKHSKDAKGREEILRVATIAANNDEHIGGLVADAIDKVGKDGVITIEEAKTTQIELKVVEGMQFDRGYISPYFITNAERMECVLEDPYILIHQKKLGNVREMLPLLEKIAAAAKPFLVIAEDVEGETLATLVVNRLRGSLRCCAVKAPSYGERRTAMLEDMAILTGGRLISEDLGIKLENVTLDDLGRAGKVVVEKENTTIMEGHGKPKAVEDRIKEIRASLEVAESEWDKEKLHERMAKLTGGVAVVNVGADTETELKERKGRADDAVNAAKAALEQGVVPGGGVTYIRSLPVLEDLKVEAESLMGINIMRKALEEPLYLIASNAGFDGSLVVSEVKARAGAEGFDAVAGQYVDLWKAGIIDPTKVVCTALENAASVATLLLTTEVIIQEIPEKAPAMPAPPMDEDMY